MPYYNYNCYSYSYSVPWKVAQVPDVAIRTLERDIRSLQLVLPGGRAPRWKRQKQRWKRRGKWWVNDG